MQIVNDLMLQLTLKDYELAKSKFIRLCSEAGIKEREIGFFGNVGFPGISDLDAIVVSDRIKLLKLICLHNNELEHDEVYRYIFWHNPVYLLHGVQKFIPYLHTLQGLYMLENGSSFYQQSKLDKKGVTLLHVIWFIFLLQTIAGLQRRVTDAIGIQFRSILLVYKNLEHSRLFFKTTHHYMARLNEPTSSEIIRKKMSANVNGIELWGDFNYALQVTCDVFDSFCKKFDFETSHWKRVSNERQIFCVGDITFVKDGKVHINKKGISILKDYVMNCSESEAMNSYINASSLSKKIYRDAGIKYPFIEPIRIPNRRFAGSVFKGLNWTKNLLKF